MPLATMFSDRSNFSVEGHPMPISAILFSILTTDIRRRFVKFRIYIHMGNWPHRLATILLACLAIFVGHTMTMSTKSFRILITGFREDFLKLTLL